MPKPSLDPSPRTFPLDSNRPETAGPQAPATPHSELAPSDGAEAGGSAQNNVPAPELPAAKPRVRKPGANAARKALASATVTTGAASLEAAAASVDKKKRGARAGIAAPKADRAGSSRSPGFAWEMAFPALFAGTVLAAGLSAPQHAAEGPRRQQRVLEPIRILPTVPPSETWVVSPRTAFSFVSLQGRLQRGAVVEGHVALAGQVSRVLVREGQHVNVGDRVLTLETETGSAPAPALPRVEAQQSRAEGRQVQAVRRKEALEARIAQAHTDYAEAQARLDSANKKLADARSLLKRVSAGEAVPDPAADTAPAPRAARRSARRRSARRQQGAGGPSKAVAARIESAQSENSEALAATSQAEDAVREASSRAKSLFAAASTAQGRERQAENALDSARDKLKSAQAQLDAGTAKADALAAARSSVAQAEGELEDAKKKSQSAHDEWQSAQSEADQARAKSSRASERAVQATRDLRIARSQAREETPQPQEPEQAEATPEAEARSRSTLSVSASVRMVREAMGEASSALSNAERLRARVQGFKRSASNISDDIQDSARGIEQAQQQVLDTTVQTSLSTLRAPASGTVLSVAGVGEGVGEGQAVVRVANGPQGLEATLQDTSGAWKQLRPAMTLPGRLLSSPLWRARAQANGIAGGAGGTITLGNSPLRMGMPILLKVRAVEAPEKPGGAASIRVAVVPDSSPRVQPKDDMAVAISLSKGSSDVISIPAIAVARGEGSQPLVGVLREVSESSQPAPSQAPAPEAAPGPEAGAVDGAPPIDYPLAAVGEPALDSPKAPPQALEAQKRGRGLEPRRERLFEIEWRAVALSDALPSALANTRPGAGAESSEVGSEKMKKVISGLEPGERILRDASQWQGRFVSTPGKPLRVRLMLDLG